MPRIVPSEAHPDHTVRHALGSAEPFELGPGGVYETDDREAIGNALPHPWLDVEYDEVEVIQGGYRDRHVPREEDVLVAENSVAFDPQEIEKVESEKRETDVERLAVESGLDQGEEHEVAGIATTLAADESDASDEYDAPDPGEEV